MEDHAPIVSTSLSLSLSLSLLSACPRPALNNPRASAGRKIPGSAAPRNVLTVAAALSSGDPGRPGAGVQVTSGHAKDRLAGAAGLRVRQRIYRRNVHQHEGREKNLQPARLQILNRADHRKRSLGVPAIAARPSGAPAHHLGRRRASAAHLPGRAARHLRRVVDLRADRAGAGAKIVAEPGDDQRHPFEVRTERRAARRSRSSSPKRRAAHARSRQASRPRRRSASPPPCRIRTRSSPGSHRPRARAPRCRGSCGKPRRRAAGCGCRSQRAASAL